MTPEQIKEATNIKSSAGTLEAVKFVRQITGLSLRDCKDFVDQLLHKVTSGTITWFKCENQLPPIKYPDAIGLPSEKVLVWGKGGWPQLSYYVHAADEWFGSSQFPFTITHWCYINYPE